jgi:hypothetical protein
MLGDALQDPAGMDRDDFRRLRLIEEENSLLKLEAERSRAALKAVEDWWLSDGMHHFVGAPYAIFAVRAALGDQQSPQQEESDGN